MRRSRSCRRSASVAAAAALALVLTGCGGDDTEPAAGETDASSEVSESPSDEPDDAATAAASEDDGDEPADAGAGTWDEDTLVPAMLSAMQEQETVQVSMSTLAGGMDVEAEGELSFTETGQDMRLVMDGTAMGAEEIELRVVDDVVYFSMPPMTAPGKFVALRPGDPGSPLGSMLGDMSGLDPRQTMDAFEDSLREVTYLGEEDVDGAELERYRITVDTRAMARSQGMPGGGSMPRGQGMPRTVDYDLWLDDDALVRRMELEMEQMALAMEFSGWGEPVSVEAPPKRDLQEMPGR